MSEEQKPKKGLGKAFDKIIMGAIIGGAIGSVLGMSVAPKKGKQTRRFLKKKAQEAIEKGRKFLEEHEEHEEIKEIKKDIAKDINKNKKKETRLFKFVKSGKGAFDDMRKIPHEE